MMKWLPPKFTRARRAAKRVAGDGSSSRNRLRLRCEQLESRLAPATVAYAAGTVNYLAFPNEANNVVFSGGPFDVVRDDTNVSLIAVPPFFLSQFLNSFNLSVGTTLGPDFNFLVGVSLGLGFNISPILWPGSAVGPPTIAQAANFANILSGVQNAQANALAQPGAPVVVGAPVPADGNVYFQIQGASTVSPVTKYEIYQAVVDPMTALAESEPNNSRATATPIPAFAQVSPLVTGDLGNKTPDYFSFQANAGDRLVVMLDNNPDGGTTVTGTALSLLDSFGNPVIPGSNSVGQPNLPSGNNNRPNGVSVNYSTDQGNAVGAIDVVTSGTYYVEVAPLGIGTGTKYRFVIDKAPGPSPVTESSTFTIQAPGFPPPLTVPPNGNVTSKLTVDSPAGSGNITRVSVALNISSSNDQNVVADLIAPDGTDIPLFSGKGGSSNLGFGDNTNDLILDDGGASFGSGSPPFAGTFKPSGSLATLNGKDSQGVWQLKLADSGSDTVALNHWSMTFSTDESGSTPQTATPLQSSTTSANNQFGQGTVEAGDTDVWSTKAPSASGDLVFAYVDTQHADPNFSQAATLAVLQGNGTVIRQAKGGGPPGLSRQDVQNIQNNGPQEPLQQLGNQAPVGSFNIDVGVGNAGDNDLSPNTVDVSTLNMPAIGAIPGFSVAGGAGPDTLLAGGGVTRFDAGGSTDVLVQNTSYPSEVTYLGNLNSVAEILVPGTSSSDTLTITFSSTDPSGTDFTIDENGTNALYHVPRKDVQEILLRGLDGNDTYIIKGIIPSYLTAGVVIEGGAGNNALTLNTIQPGDTVVYRKGTDDSSGSILVGTAANGFQPPVTFSSVQHVPVLQSGGLPQNVGLVVFPHDGFEKNDSLAQASPIGAGAALNRVANIDPGGDQDFYQFVAQETGTLDFQVYFALNSGLPDNGLLFINVLDATGHVIGSGTATTGNQRVTIPVVRNQVYFLQVFGATPDAINTYSFSIINEPPPAPFQIALQPTSDSGRNNTDNLTKNTTPTFNIFLDDARLLEFLNLHLVPDTVNNNAHDGDFGVDVFDNGVLLGSAFFVGPTSSVPQNHWEFTPTAGQLIEGKNQITGAVWIRDHGTPPITGRGDFSVVPLTVILDTMAPPVFFGPTPGLNGNGLDPSTDTGAAGQPITHTDRDTSDTTPTFFGTAEANAVIRVYDDRNGNGIADSGDVLLALTTAVPIDGTNVFPNGRWVVASNVDLNNPIYFPPDGQRNILVTAEDPAGNVSAAQPLAIFVDTQGAQVTKEFITGFPDYDLLAPKPMTGPTPLVHSITINLKDLDPRTAQFLLDAINAGVAVNPNLYTLIGDRSGQIPIVGVTAVNDPPVAGQPATAHVVIQFAAALPDDRYTFTVSDQVVDLAGNKLLGGPFRTVFIVDSRPEIATVSSASVYADINGNFVYDPQTQNNDHTNNDLVFHIGLVSDAVFAGNFSPQGQDANGFDKLGAYGKANGLYRFLLDLNGDGVAETTMLSGLQNISANALPVAGRFNPSINASEIALFDGLGNWFIDYNHTNNLTSNSLVIHDGLSGFPIVGDFDGNGSVDLATYRPDLDTFYFDLNPLGGGPHVFTTLHFGAGGVGERPVAADFNQDGVTDIGLFIPSLDGQPERNNAEWQILLSSGTPVAGTVNTLNHPFQPAPLGTDIVAQFGDGQAAPLVGNFDPPGGPPDPSLGISVQQAYEQYLERPVDGPSLAYWTQQLQSGAASYASFIGAVLGSGEFFALHGNTNAGFISGLYEQLLGREPSGGDLTFWNGVLASGASPAQVAQTIFSTPEAQNQVAVLTQQFQQAVGNWVTNLYQDVLHRTPVSSEVQYWAQQVTAGNVSRGQVAAAIANSDEANGGVIAGYYHQYLGANRAVDPGGMTYWLGVLHHGGRLEDVLAGILNSPEYYLVHGNNPTGFVDALYHDLLGRSADANGETYWVGQAKTRDAAAVIHDFVFTPEYRKGLVDAWYQDYFHRPADTGGESYFTSLLNQGLTQQQIETTLLAAADYFQRKG